MKSTFAAILRLAPTGLLAGLLAFVLGSSASNTYAAGDAYGSFDESGQYNYHSYSGPGRLSIGHEGYDEWHRAHELADRQAEQWRQESLRQERERNSNAAQPVNPNPYNFPEAVYGPNGQMMLCTKGFNATYCN